jgi:AcrR family transcriptional regulator
VPADSATTPSPRRRNRRGDGERLRHDLLAAAAGLVTETGDASALSLRAIASRVGIATTSVYLHFPDVISVKIALAQQWFSEFAEVRDAAAAGIGDPARALIVRCQTYARYALANPGPYRLMFGPGLGPLAGPALQVGTASQRAFDALVGAIERCQQSGVTPPDSDPRRLAVLLWSALHGQVTLRMDRPAFPWPELDDTIRDLVERIVGLPAAPTKRWAHRRRGYP